MPDHDSTPAAAPPPAPARSRPTAPSDRFASMDVLRGIAILGILGMNILSFALPPASYESPMARGAVAYNGEFSGLNYFTWVLQALFIDQKMMSTFAMLFGCGLMVMHSNAERTGARRTWIWYKRCAVLLGFGLIHAYGLWYGDVLTLYACCGMLLWPFRRLPASVLFSLAVIMLALGMAINVLTGLEMHRTMQQGDEARQLAARSVELTPAQQEALDTADALHAQFEPEKDETDAEVSLRRTASGYFHRNLDDVLLMHPDGLALYAAPRSLGMMLIGMALCRFGIPQGRASRLTYRTLAAGGLLIGGVITIAGMFSVTAHQFRFDWLFLVDWQYFYLGSVFVAIGLCGLTGLWVGTSNVLPRLRRWLAATGRMAFTNYLTQTLIGVGIFSGLGFGCLGMLQRWQLALVVLAIWALQVTWSVWWMARFSQGPLEWLWRRLVYGNASKAAE